MNRRFFLLALAVAAVFAPLKLAHAAPAELPIKIGVIDPPDPDGSRLAGPTISFNIRASERGIIFPTITKADEPGSVIYDFETKTVRAVGKEGVLVGGNGEWQFVGGAAPQLLIFQGASAGLSYSLPTEDSEELNAIPAELYQEATLVATNDERVEMAIGAHYYRWNTETRELENNVSLDLGDGFYNQALTRDGERLVSATLSEISVLSTQTGEFAGRTELRKFLGTDDTDTSEYSANISERGTYAVYASPLSNAMKFHIIATADARELWLFGTNDMDDPVVLSPDEKWVAVGHSDRKIWVVHDAETGEISRNLPLVAGATSGAFSPDGATLYSIADGVLYRQSAR